MSGKFRALVALAAQAALAAAHDTNGTGATGATRGARNRDRRWRDDDGYAWMGALWLFMLFWGCAVWACWEGDADQRRRRGMHAQLANAARAPADGSHTHA